MSRNLVIAIVLAVAVIGLGAVSFLLQKRAMPEAIQIPDYAASDAWSYRPIVPAKAVWEGGWDIDVVLILPSSTLTAATQARADRLRAAAEADASGLASDLAAFGKVYAPVFRADQREQDVRRALEHYLNADNNGRAFIIALTDPLAEDAFAPIATDPLVAERFGGFLVLVPRAQNVVPADAIAGLSESATPKLCAGTTLDSADCVRALPVQRRDGRLSADIEKTGLLAWREAWLGRLETDADQLAAPLGEAEYIAPSEIRSPGDTDEARTGPVP